MTPEWRFARWATRWAGWESDDEHFSGGAGGRKDRDGRPRRDGLVSPRKARRADPFDRGGKRGLARPVGGSVPGVDRTEEWPDGDWQVRRVTGGAADKVYRCPGCDQEIRPGLPHLVSWPAWPGGEDERRHWHTACWRNRVRRGPGRSRY